MRVISLLAPLAIAQVALAYVPVLDKRGCAADNCARAVTATAATSLHSADCNSFLATTVTPSAATVTVTAAPEKRDVGAPALARRDKTVPSYASACSGSVRYASACTCLGATGTTVTAATPTSTVTVTPSTSDTSTSTTETSTSTTDTSTSTTDTSTSTTDTSTSTTDTSTSTTDTSTSTTDTSTSTTDTSTSTTDTSTITSDTSTSTTDTATSTTDTATSTTTAPSRFTAVPLDGGCVTQEQAAVIVDNFNYLLASPQADDFVSTAYALFADDFIDTSDSINSLAGIPLGSDTFSDKDQFIAGSGSQPPLYVNTLEFVAACDRITWRWQHTSGVGSDIQKVKGIDLFHIAQTGQIEHTFAEFNSLAFSYDLGSPECATSSRIKARNRFYIEPRMI